MELFFWLSFEQLVNRNTGTVRRKSALDRVRAKYGKKLGVGSQAGSAHANFFWGGGNRDISGIF